MAIEILVPDLPESVADATVATWHKKVGETVKRDEVLVEIETDKVVLEVPALSDGVVTEILQEEGATVVSKQLLGKLSTQQAGDISSETVKDLSLIHIYTYFLLGLTMAFSAVVAYISMSLNLPYPNLIVVLAVCHEK